MLKTILEAKKIEVEQLYSVDLEYPLSIKERRIPAFSFVEAIQKPNRSSALIAEVKKASPSKGIIRADFDPLEIAREYEAAGADCLSVLTDQLFFQGNKSYIELIKESVSLPILRKDFIIDSVQIKESLALGADAILLIVKALPLEKLVELYIEAEEAGLDVLIEIANQSELEAIFSRLKPKMIGINNRDLQTFQTDTAVTRDLLPLIPKDCLVISESGIHSADTVRELEAAGVGGFLIGEYFMKQQNIREAVRKLYATG